MSCSSRSFDAERRRWLLASAGIAALVAATPAGASAPVDPPAEVASAFSPATLQGSGRLRMFGFQVYDARLWQASAAVPAADWVTVPAALEIIYLRALKGGQIAERSLDEMRRQRELAPDETGRWLKAMQEFFPDVQPGHRIVGVVTPESGMRFYVNGKRRGELREPEFARLFMGIWLAPQTSQPTLREALLGRMAATR